MAGKSVQGTPRTDGPAGVTMKPEGSFFSSLKQGFRQLELSYETGFAPVAGAVVSLSSAAAAATTPPPMQPNPPAPAVAAASPAEQAETAASTSAAPTPALAPASEWFSGLFKKDKQEGQKWQGSRMGFSTHFNEKVVEAQLENGTSPFRSSGASISGRGGGGGHADGDSYYRHVNTKAIDWLHARTVSCMC